MTAPLLLPDLLRAIDTNQPMMVAQPGRNGRGCRLPPHMLTRQSVRPSLMTVAKFQFVSDQDGAEWEAVAETAAAMSAAGLFHLPAPEVWVEDPFDTDPAPNGCPALSGYLCVEDADAGTLDIMLFQRAPVRIDGVVQRPIWTLYPAFARMEVARVSRQFGIASLEAGHPWGTAKKLPRHSYTIIRIPSSPATGDGAESGRRLRHHLVRGYVWGKNTRSIDEQR